MSTITITLRSLRHSPWGLLTDGPRPQPIVWLTSEDPTKSVDSSLFSESDIDSLLRFEGAEIISVEGLDIPESLPSQLSLQPSLPTENQFLSVTDKQTNVEVSTLTQKELSHSEEVRESLKNQDPDVSELLALHAYEIRKRLKVMAKGSYGPRFFQAVRRSEMKGKNRKTVVALLAEIVRGKIAEVGLERGFRDYKSLSDTYYDEIIEYPEDDDLEG